MSSAIQRLTNPLVADNPIAVQILGVCSALAVTTSLVTALTMAAALTVVLALSNAVISLIRRHVPTAIRLIVQITIIASLVIVADQLLKTFAFEMSQRLSIFVGLIVTNCLVLGRAESFAMHNPVWPSLVDGVGNGLGYSLILMIVGAIRELFGAGTLVGIVILPTVEDGGWYQPLDLMLLAPSAFLVIGLLVWLIRSWRTEQREPSSYSVRSEASSVAE